MDSHRFNYTSQRSTYCQDNWHTLVGLHLEKNLISVASIWKWYVD